MAENVTPLFSSRFLIPFTFVSGGGFYDLDDFTGGWSSIGVDYGNLGNETSPPTLDYINEVDNTNINEAASNGNAVGALLPLSAEGVEISVGGILIQYRHPRWARY